MKLFLFSLPFLSFFHFSPVSLPPPLWKERKEADFHIDTLLKVANLVKPSSPMDNFRLTIFYEEDIGTSYSDEVHVLVLAFHFQINSDMRLLLARLSFSSTGRPAVFRIRKICIRIRILGPISIITDPDPTCSPAIVNEHYWSMHHISKLKVPIQKFSLPYPLRSAICMFGIKEIRLHIILINNVAKKE